MPIIMEGTRPPTGASPTQPYKCGQNVKVKVNVNVFISALAKNQRGFDFDFNILTAFIRLGRAGPDRGRVPSNPVWFKVG